MKVEIIKCLKDNFSYLLINEKNQNACVIDPSESGPIIDFVEKENFDIVFLDENMPGLTGLETLAEIKQKTPNLPIVMITKSEEEYIMEEADF